eukprot:jgi/Chlat1/5926/Chrsp4S06413
MATAAAAAGVSVVSEVLRLSSARAGDGVRQLRTRRCSAARNACRPVRCQQTCSSLNRSTEASSSECSAAETTSRREALTSLVATALLAQLPSGRALASIDISEPVVTDKVFFTITVDGKPAGRIVVGVYGQAAPIGAQRFVDLAVGKQGVGYRRTLFTKVDPAFIQDVGVRSFSYGDTAADVGITGGPTSGQLLPELQAPGRPLHTKPWTVSLIVNNPLGSEGVSAKLIARDGKFINVEESTGPPRPNGSSFIITTRPCPELDSVNLVVGRVLEGQDIVQKLSQLPAAQDKTDNPFFKTAKMMGDVRATVAQAGFGRPFSRVVVASSGLMS